MFKIEIAKFWKLGLILITLGALVIRLWGLNSVGETWDEVAYYDAARVYGQNLRDLNFEADAWQVNREHPAIGKWLYLVPSLPAFASHQVDYTGGRLLSALMGTLTVLITMLIGRRLYNPRIGLMAGLILALSPVMIGLNRVLGLDTPTTLFFVLTVWLFLEGLESKNSGRWYLASALSLGLAIGTRLSNLLLYPLLVGILVLYRWSDWRKRKNLSEFLWAIPFAIIPFLVVILTWPWLWQNFAGHLRETIGHWSAVQSVFLGSIYEVGAGYFLVYLLVTTPALVVISSLFFLAQVVTKRRRSDIVAAAWIAAVFMFSFYALHQGGPRYLLQLFPALAIGSAVIFNRLLEAMQNFKPQLVSGLIVFFVLYLFANAIYNQPYQLDYYNEFVGGSGKVAQKKLFQIGWWGEGIEEAVAWLNAEAEPDASVWFLALPDRSQRLLRSDLNLEPLGQYLIINPGYTWYVDPVPALKQYQLVHMVQTGGASVSEVWKKQ